MAKTVDELVLKMTVEGSAQIKTSTDQMNNLDAATKKTAETMKSSQGQIRNVAFQIQDLAVQIAGGTNAFVALGQQLPQLLGGFGVMGAVIGALAAVGIPLARAGLTAMGVDMRNLDERTKDLSDSVKQYQAAQMANLPTLQGLGQTYGVLTGTAKDFFDIQEKLTKQKADIGLSAALQKLGNEFSGFTAEREAEVRKTWTGMAGTADAGIYLARQFKAFTMGLTQDQAKTIADMLKGIETATPEQAAVTLNKILEYLKEAGVESGKVKKFFDETVEPILKINNQILEMNKSMKESAIQASNFNAEMIGLQNSYQPDINAARRNFDQITAARKEGELKIAEFTKQIREKESKDQVDRSKELTAFTLRTNQDVADKIKDIAKSQSETTRAAQLTNDAKGRQLDIERAIIDLKDKGLFAAEYNLKYDEDILRIGKEYSDTLQNISEQRRKNQITAEQALTLEKEAANLRDRATGNAGLQRDATVRAKIIKDEMEISRKSIEDQIAGQQRLGDAVRKINDQRQTFNFEQSLKGLSPLRQQIAKINEEARKASLEAGRVFAAGFESEDGLTAERAQELANGLNEIASGYKNIASEQIKALGVSQEYLDNFPDSINESLTAVKNFQEEFRFGLRDAWKDYKDNALDFSKQAKDGFQNFTQGMEDSFVRFVQTGKLSFNDLANSILADLARIAFKRAVVGLGSLFGFAAGGQVMPDTPIIVGERGPEMFVPRTAGTIIPNNALGNIGGGGYDQAPQTTVNYNIQAVDAASFRSLVARDPSFIYAVTEQGRRSQPTRRVA